MRLVCTLQEQASRKLRVTASRRWAEARGRRIPAPTMDKKVEELVQEWFSLVSGRRVVRSAGRGRVEYSWAEAATCQ